MSPGQIRRVVTLALCLALPAAVTAQPQHAATLERQDQSRSRKEGGFPDATFELTYRKYTLAENQFSPFYSWDGSMALEVTVFRWGPGSLNAEMLIHTIGTENLGGTSSVGVGATGYVFGMSYAHTYSEDFRLSGGITHLSSHLTRDLTQKDEEQRAKGATIPTVSDPSQYNVVFIKAYRRFPAWILAPELELGFSPVNFRLSGGRLGDVRPLYLGTRWNLWRRGGTAVVAATQHEFGSNPFSLLALRLDLYAPEQDDGRFQIFLEASPGDSVHVSPNIGAYRDGIALGFRMKFRA